MSPYEANHILYILCGSGLSTDSLHADSEHLSIDLKNGSATLDGSFNANELEAIACWMRYPSAVVDATPPATAPSDTAHSYCNVG